MGTPKDSKAVDDPLSRSECRRSYVEVLGGACVLIVAPFTAENGYPDGAMRCHLRRPSPPEAGMLVWDGAR